MIATSSVYLMSCHSDFTVSLDHIYDQLQFLNLSLSLMCAVHNMYSEYSWVEVKSPTAGADGEQSVIFNK